jgi:phosphoglucosamine mutase
MARKLFGTDGLRGAVNSPSLDPELILKVAYAIKNAMALDGGKVIIGKDTRISGYIYESILEAGFLAAGLDVCLTGPLTTPALCYYTKKFGFNVGCMISASHNSYRDNGIKLFTASGEKISKEIETKIEEGIDQASPRLSADHIGKATRLPFGISSYQNFCILKFQKNFLKDFKVVCDSSNGGGFKLAPRIIAALGADLLPIGSSPNGYNINDRCGSTDPALVATLVVNGGYDIGVAIDGDGDRVVLIDELGNKIDGDQIIYILAKALKAKNNLRGPIAITVASNCALKSHLEDLGINVIVTNVGDKNIARELKLLGGHLGGESSGHIINLDYNLTGDGVLAALQVMQVMHQTKRKLSELTSAYQAVPSKNINYKITHDRDGLSNLLHTFGTVWSTKMLNQGRVLVRRSGTEPLIRLLIESKDPALFSEIKNDFEDCLKEYI